MKKEYAGFSPEKEEKFLRRLPEEVRDINLAKELTTQLAEDFGLVRFTARYLLKDGVIIDPDSGEGIVELTSRGTCVEETESIKIIEKGLSEFPEKTWVHFSPKNDELNYPENCVDFWRVVNEKKEVVWNRIVVDSNFDDMNKVRLKLGADKSENERDMMKSPLSAKMILSELFNLFSLCSSKYSGNYEHIEKVVNQNMEEFLVEFGSELTEDSDLILRLYSACHEFLKSKGMDGYVLKRNELDNFMHGKMMAMEEEKSFGCSSTTMVARFGEGKGYYVSADGKVQFGEIPKDFKLCEHCGCWYSGDKCPLC